MGFKWNTSRIYIKENSNYVLELLRKFRGALMRSKRYCAFLFQSENHSHIIRSGRSEVAAYKINNCWWSKPSRLVLESQTGEFVLINLWVGFQSHKRGSLCSTNPRREGVRGHVSKLLLEVAIDLGLNLIVKTSILL